MGRMWETQCVTRRGALHSLQQGQVQGRPKKHVSMSKRIVVRSIKQAQVQKKWNEDQKMCSPN